MQLSDEALFKSCCYIDGEWRKSTDESCDEVLNPATGAKLGSVPHAGTAETRDAIDAAVRAFPDWAARTAAERAVTLSLWSELMLEHQRDLAQIMTAEQGKPLAEARE